MALLLFFHIRHCTIFHAIHTLPYKYIQTVSSKKMTYHMREPFRVYLHFETYLHHRQTSIFWATVNFFPIFCICYHMTIYIFTCPWKMEFYAECVWNSTSIAYKNWSLPLTTILLSSMKWTTLSMSRGSPVICNASDNNKRPEPTLGSSSETPVSLVIFRNKSMARSSKFDPTRVFIKAS